ncbi:amidohydrolase family protein [Christiangramia salexigens]|uniref:amidohydrolase family protein n=1 Tax=Christiangramia salexigens TaxID=1913577 RepID=UPI0009F80B82|nr:amidohydrolase family protein [Christiangramia salexigens]
MKNILSLLFLFYLTNVSSQIIDMHTHSYTEEDYWGGNTHPTGVESPKSVEEHLEQTIKLMDKHGIEYAVVSGWSLEGVEKYVAADSRFIPGYMDEGNPIPVEQFEDLVKSGKIKVFGEVSGVYFGKTLNDPMYAPYLEICEKYNIPVAYHSGGAPPMAPFTCCPDFRISIGDPLLIEDVLVKYPKLRIYLMHAGEVYFEQAVRMMSMYKSLYVDLGAILWVDPLIKDYAIRFLKLAQTAGVLDRVMFGSDQMVWPGAITRSIDFINNLDFLSNEEKQMILYGNAKQFLNLK